MGLKLSQQIFEGTWLMKTASILFLTLIVISGAVPAAQADYAPLAAADNNFAFKLLKQLVKEEPSENIFISPYSASTVLQMGANGAVGQTKTEMQQMLGTENLSTADVNTANKNIAQALNDGNTNVILTTANAIWYRQGFSVQPDFLACNRDYFDATVDPLDFADPHAVAIINHWASEKTHGRIDHIADGMIDPNNTRLFLANAVYFKGKWADPFDASNTKDQPFYLRDGSQKTVSMMGKFKTFTYRRGTGYQAVRLPYEDGNLAMYIFLPDTNSSPERLLSIMNGHTWQQVTKPGFNDEAGTLNLPKFRLEYSVQLKSPLQALGMKTAFDPLQADFSGIAPQLYISAVLQKTFVEVKEEGTEAAAVTGIDVEAAGIEMPPPHPFEMIVNRPFLFLIEDNQTGTILFMGVMHDPPAH
jgi:serine protease inhibitor